VKVAISGHADGPGSALAGAFRAEGHEVVLLELPDASASGRERLVEAAAACDVLVTDRTRTSAEAQLQLLYGMAERWRGQDRTIVSLGSRAAERHAADRLDTDAVYQRALDAACQQLFSRPDQRPRVLNVRLGPVEAGPAEAALDPEDVARVVLWALAQPAHVHVSALTVGRHLQA
jgi:nucleoside-diphosphate-sugar epimerase